MLLFTTVASMVIKTKLVGDTIKKNLLNKKNNIKLGIKILKNIVKIMG